MPCTLTTQNNEVWFYLNLIINFLIFFMLFWDYIFTFSSTGCQWVFVNIRWLYTRLRTVLVSSPKIVWFNVLIIYLRHDFLQRISSRVGHLANHYNRMDKFSLNSWCIVKVNELTINLDVIFDKEIITFGFERMQGVFQVTLALP